MGVCYNEGTFEFVLTVSPSRYFYDSRFSQNRHPFVVKITPFAGQPITLVFPLLKICDGNANINRSGGCSVVCFVVPVLSVHICVISFNKGVLDPVAGICVILFS